MEDTIVVLRFNDLGPARHALHELKALDRSRRLRVSAAALVQRSEEGGSGTPRGIGDAEGFYVPEKGIVGMMVDAISGPTGAVFARPTESSADTATDAPTRTSVSSCSRRSAGISSRELRS